MKKNARILIIDDEKDMLNGCNKILQAFGYTTTTSSDGSTAISLLKEDEFDLILCDLLMPEVDGLQVLQAALELAPYTPVVIFSAYGTVDRAITTMKLGAFDFLEKPFKTEDLKTIIEKGLDQRKLYSERANLIRQHEPIFSIGIAAKKLGIAIPTLRMYEKEGLIIPHRTKTGRRLYSLLDLKRIRNIKKLIKIDGLNLAGIRRLMAVLPCWELKPCKSEMKKNCIAYKDNIKACWMHLNTGCKVTLITCRNCTVYLDSYESIYNIKQLLKKTNY